MKCREPDPVRTPLLTFHLILAAGSLIMAGLLAVIAYYAAPVEQLHSAAFSLAAATGTGTAAWILKHAHRDYLMRS